MKIYASLIPVLFLVLATISTDVHMNANETVNVTNDEPILPLKIQCTSQSSEVRYFASLSDVSNVQYVKPPIQVNSKNDGYIGGKCTDYEEWDCDNPYGDCYEDGAEYSECVIQCIYSRLWVYCDGCGDPCIEE